jgi:hypothetical protein
VKVLSILARYGTAQYATAEADLAEVFRAQLPDVERDVVVVDTALRPGEAEVAQGRVVIGGDNSAREFSAFDAGLAYVGDRIWEYDLINLTTSAFRELYRDYLERFRPAVLASVTAKSVCLGHIDCYNEPVRIGGCTSQHWLRTSCVFLSPTELRILGSLVSAGQREQWFSGDPSAPFRSDAPLSSNYQRLIIDWVTGKDIGQGVTWHSRISLDRKGLAEFEQKTLCVLNEHLFGLRLRASGCRTIDVTWLSGVLGRSGASNVEWNTPWWQQLAGRDRDAIRVTRTAVLSS